MCTDGRTGSPTCSPALRLSPCRSGWFSNGLLVSAQDEDASDESTANTPLLRRALTTAAAVVIGGSSSALPARCAFARSGGDVDRSTGEARYSGRCWPSPWPCRVHSWASSSIFATCEAHRRRSSLDVEWSEAPGGASRTYDRVDGHPPLATTHGAQIDSLIGWIHIFMLILFVGWGGSSSTPSFVSGNRGIRWRITRGHVAQVDLFRSRRRSGRSDSSHRVRNPAVGRES
jgi:hypothetical protein